LLCLLASRVGCFGHALPLCGDFQPAGLVVIPFWSFRLANDIPPPARGNGRLLRSWFRTSLRSRQALRLSRGKPDNKLACRCDRRPRFIEQGCSCRAMCADEMRRAHLRTRPGANHQFALQTAGGSAWDCRTAPYLCTAHQQPYRSLTIRARQPRCFRVAFQNIKESKGWGTI
jgi:hypothetical protein